MKATTLIDYLTFRNAFQSDPDLVIEQKLKMDSQLFELREYSPLPNYRRSKFFGGISVCFDATGARGAAAADDWTEDDQQASVSYMGICVTMSGEGCRTFEQMSTHRFAEAGAMSGLIHAIYLDPEANATRVDLAADDHSGLLNMDTIVNYARGLQINSRMTKTRIVIDADGKIDRGQTLYIGAPSSALRVRIYDKAKEQYTPEQPEYLEPWVRVEFVMRGKHANGFINAFCNSDNLGDLAAGVLNNHLRFIERDDSNITRCSTAQWWADFVESVEEVKLFVPEPIQHTIDRMAEWLTYQIAPSLATFYKAYGWEGLKRMLETGRGNMSAKHNAVLKDFEQRKMSHKLICPGAAAASAIV